MLDGERKLIITITLLYKEVLRTRTRRRLGIARAIVLFHVESGSENHVLKNVKKVEGVEEAYISYGSYDIVAKVKAKSMDALRECITGKLRKISNVRATITLLFIEE